MNTSSLVPAAPDPRAEADAALAALTAKEAAFAKAYASGMRPGDAAEFAGYPRRSASVIRKRPDVRAAVALLVRARDAVASLNHEESCRLLEAAVRVRLSDLLLYTDDGGAVDIRPRESLSPAEELRIVRYSSRVHASHKGNKGTTRYIDVELIPALHVLDRLAKLRGWDPGTPSFQILLAQVAPEASANKYQGLSLVHDLAADLLDVDGPEMGEYLRAHASGDRETQVRLLREAAARLRRVRESVTVEVVQ